LSQGTGRIQRDRKPCTLQAKCRGSQAGFATRGKNRHEEKQGGPVDGETCIVLPGAGELARWRGRGRGDSYLWRPFAALSSSLSRSLRSLSPLRAAANNHACARARAHEETPEKEPAQRAPGKLQVMEGRGGGGEEGQGAAVILGPSPRVTTHRSRSPPPPSPRPPSRISHAESFQLSAVSCTRRRAIVRHVTCVDWAG